MVGVFARMRDLISSNMHYARCLIQPEVAVLSQHNSGDTSQRLAPCQLKAAKMPLLE